MQRVNAKVRQGDILFIYGSEDVCIYIYIMKLFLLRHGFVFSFADAAMRA